MKRWRWFIGFLLLSLSMLPAKAALLDDVGSVTGGQLGSDLVADFAFAGSLQMYTKTGKPVLAKADNTIRGIISLDLVTAGGTAAMRSSQGFFGIPWKMHGVTLSTCGQDFSVNTNLKFDWGVNRNIPVFSKFSLTPGLNTDPASWTSPMDAVVFTVAVIDTDHDGIPGQRMVSGPFKGFTPVFSGTATMSGLRQGYYKNPHIAVPGSSGDQCTPLGPTIGGFM